MTVGRLGDPGWFDAFAQAAYQRSATVRQGALDAVAGKPPQHGPDASATLAGFLATPAGRDALERGIRSGADLLGKFFGAAGGPVQLRLPLA